MLKLDIPEGVTIIGYADDLVLMVVTKYRTHIENEETTEKDGLGDFCRISDHIH